MSSRLYTHVLVPTDFRPECQSAYRVAMAAALGCGARVSLLHVAPLPTPDMDEIEYRGLDAIRLMHRSAEWWSARENIAEVIAAENADLTTRLRAELPTDVERPRQIGFAVRRGEVGEEVMRFSGEQGVDLIVTTAGRSRFPVPFVSTLAELLARKLPRVEVIRVLASPRSDGLKPAGTGRGV
jgi:nucleotide-binding universal stress UspA family protein